MQTRLGTCRIRYNSPNPFFFTLLILTWLSIPASSAIAAGGTFAPVGNLTQATEAPPAALLTSGKVLVIVGTSGNLDLFDPTTQNFTAAGTANSNYNTATLLKSGKVLLAGNGDNSTNGTCPPPPPDNVDLMPNTTRLYDPSTGSLTATGCALEEFQAGTNTRLADGRVLFVGGGDRNMGGTPIPRSEIYDPATGKFTFSCTLPRGFYGHTATLLNNGKVLIAGGSTFFDGSGGEQANAWLYDPSTGTFTATGNMTIPRLDHTATLLGNGKVLITGGSDGSQVNGNHGVRGVAELYDPSTGKFAATGSMIFARAGHTANLLTSGQVMVAGGFDGTSIVASAELYNPTSGTFSATGHMNAARELAAAVRLNSGKVWR